MGIAAELCIFTNDRITIDYGGGTGRLGDRQTMPDQMRNLKQQPTTRNRRNGRGATAAVRRPIRWTAVAGCRRRRADHGRSDTGADRRRAGPLHHRSGRRQAGGGGGAAQSLPAAAPARGDARRGRAEEHPDDGADRGGQDGDRAAGRQDRRRAVRQGRGDPVHRGRLRGAGRRVDRARPVRGRDRHAAQPAAGAGQGRGRSGGATAAGRLADGAAPGRRGQPKRARRAGGRSTGRQARRRPRRSGGGSASRSDCWRC